MQVNYINAHATSTLVGDIAEVRAVKSAFPDMSKMKINGTKSMIGHCLGAAGGMEAIATLKAIQTGWVHPTLNQVSLLSAHVQDVSVSACGVHRRHCCVVSYMHTQYLMCLGTVTDTVAGDRQEGWQGQERGGKQWSHRAGRVVRGGEKGIGGRQWERGLLGAEERGHTLRGLGGGGGGGDSCRRQRFAELKSQHRNEAAKGLLSSKLHIEMARYLMPNAVCSCPGKSHVYPALALQSATCWTDAARGRQGTCTRHSVLHSVSLRVLTCCLRLLFCWLHWSCAARVQLHAS